MTRSYFLKIVSWACSSLWDRHSLIWVMRCGADVNMTLYEEIGLAVVAMGKCEHGHVQLHGLAVYLQLHLAPVKLAFLTGRMILADTGINALWRFLSCYVFTRVGGHCGVAEVIVLLLSEYLPDTLQVHALLAVALKLLLFVPLHALLNVLPRSLVEFRTLTL